MKAFGFTVENWKSKAARSILLGKSKPIEDFFEISRRGRFVSIADGVTRDPRNMPLLPSMKDIPGMINFLKNYPNPSSAFQRAKEFCEYFNLYLAADEMQDPYFPKPQSVYNAFCSINKLFLSSNESYKKSNGIKDFDYLEHDIPGCTAVGVVEDNGVLFYGYIADCGLAVFDKKGNIQFKTENQGPNSRGSIDRDVKIRYGTDFAHPEGRKIIRSQYRNNPSNPLSYGVLTGEPKAMEYLAQGSCIFNEGDLGIVYSDGLEDVVNSVDFADKIRKNQIDCSSLRNFCARMVKTEGTMVVIQR